MKVGDYIKVKHAIYDSSIKSKHYTAHFYSVVDFYKIVSIENNGFMVVKNKFGCLKLLHTTVYSPYNGLIMAVYSC